MSELESISLLACPFCGSKECYVQEDSRNYNSRCPKLYYYATCLDCEVQGPEADKYDGAAKLWNTRKENQ